MTASDNRAAPPWWFLALLPLCVLVLVFAAFQPALGGKFLTWDDTEGVARNEELRRGGGELFAWAFTTTQMGHYQPLAWLSLALDVAGEPVDAATGALGDSAAARCHRTNLWLHSLGAIAFGLLAERLLRAASRAWSAPPSAHAIALAALFASLLWALHPLRVESVAWITERRDVLSAVPLVLSVYAYVLWADGRPLEGRRAGGVAFYLASLALLLVSLAAKAWGIVVPLVLVVLDFHPLRRAAFDRRALARSLLEKAPFLALSLGFAFLAARAQASLQDAMPSLVEHSLAERALQACYGLCFYAWKSVVPSGLLALYELPRDVSLAEARFLVPALAVPAAAVLLFLARRRLPGLAAGALVATLCVAPVLGFAQAGPQLVADRYTYLHGFAFALLVAGALLAWSRRQAWVPWFVGGVLVVLLAAATRAQTAVWRDTESLWTHVLAARPGHVVGNLSLGNERARRAFEAGTPPEIASRLREAERLFRAGLAASEDPRFATRLALVHDALAKLEPERAEEHARTAREFSERAVKLAIATGRVSPEARFQHALKLLELDRVDEALAELEWYVGARPDDSRGREALEQARAKQAARRGR